MDKTVFTGFTQETSDFFLELAFNNERPWFMANKERFERCVNSPFRALSTETAELMSRRFPQHSFKLHIARIYRDARRLHGQGPYKDHLWFSLIGAAGNYETLGFWFEVGAVDYSFGVGSFRSTPEQMEAFRAGIDANPARFERIAAEIAAMPEYRNFGDAYRRPKGDKGELINQWYNRKNVGVECCRSFGEELLKPELPEYLAGEYAKLMPLYVFLEETFIAAANTERRKNESN